MAELAVVIPAYGETAVVQRSLDALVVAAERIGGDIDIVAVLNRAMNVTGVRTVETSQNRGFAGGVMAGFRDTDAPWVAVVNDDCVVEPDALRLMVAAGRTDDHIGAVAGLLLFADRPGVVNSAGLEIDELGVASDRLVGAPEDRAVEGDVFGASGGFALYRRKMLDEVGGFDETFFAYLEDADLAWRARMLGWRAVFIPTARAKHAHSASLGHASPQKHFLVGRNRVRMLAKNATRRQLRRHVLGMIAYDVAYVAYVALRHRTLAPARGRIAGIADWSTYRKDAIQRPAPLTAPRWFRAALRRNSAYRG